MNNVRAKFEEIWPVPAGVYWDERWGYLTKDMDDDIQDECIRMDARLDTFTRCQETTSIHLSLIDELVQSLQWYVDEDEINEGDPDNEYWVAGKHAAESLCDRAKQILGREK